MLLESVNCPDMAAVLRCRVEGGPSRPESLTWDASARVAKARSTEVSNDEESLMRKRKKRVRTLAQGVSGTL